MPVVANIVSRSSVFYLCARSLPAQGLSGSVVSAEPERIVMHFAISHLRKTGLFALGLSLFLGLSAVAMSWRLWSHSSAPVATVIPTQGQANKERIPTFLVTLSRFGFQPAAMKLPEGKALLVVRNISGADKLQLELAEVRGQKLVVEKTKEGKPFWEKPLNLKAGEYRLSVTENPNWTLALTVIAPEKK